MPSPWYFCPCISMVIWCAYEYINPKVLNYLTYIYTHIYIYIYMVSCRAKYDILTHYWLLTPCVVIEIARWHQAITLSWACCIFLNKCRFLIWCLHFCRFCRNYPDLFHATFKQLSILTITNFWVVWIVLWQNLSIWHGNQKPNICHSHDVYSSMRSDCISLQWRHNGRDGVLNHQPRDCLLNRLFGRRSKKTSKLRVAGRCAGNSPGTSSAGNVSIS